MIPQIYHTVGYPAKIPNPYQKNGMVSDPTHTIPGYGMVSLGMEYPMEYTIPFRLVEILYRKSIIATNIEYIL